MPHVAITIQNPISDQTIIKNQNMNAPLYCSVPGISANLISSFAIVKFPKLMGPYLP